MSSPSRHRYWRWLTVLVLVVLPMVLQAQSGVGNKGLDTNRLGLAKRVVQASGAEAIILKSIELTLPAQRAQNPTINPEFWDRFTTKGPSRDWGAGRQPGPDLCPAFFQG
jgi:hypothetical protein